MPKTKRRRKPQQKQREATRSNNRQLAAATARGRFRDWNEARGTLQDIADRAGEWAGVPTPISGFRLVLEDRARNRDQAMRVMDMTDAPGPAGRVCTTEDVDDTMFVRNRWFSYDRNLWVTLYEQRGKVRLYTQRAAPAMDRFTFWVSGLGVAQAWDVKAELVAQDKLAALVKPHLMDNYLLTGGLLETSARSRVTYVLRRGRPTVAMVPSDRTKPDGDSHMKVLAVLCMHPLGYYAGTYCGAMVPTDDVLAHLMWIRGDERGFWAKCNQHRADSPEAGL